MAAQMIRYFSSSCDEKAAMLASSVDRVFDSADLTPADVVKKCKTGSQLKREFVLHEINVVGTPGSRQLLALVDLGFYNTGDHALVGVSSWVEMVMELDAGWEDLKNPTFPITSISETVKAA